MIKRNIVHIEIPAANSQAAGKFYADLFGWEIQHVQEMDYTMWDAGHGSSGGFSNVSQGAQPGEVLIYVNSEDIAADLARAEALGGVIVTPKTEIPNTGWFGMFKDPTGNVIALYTSKNPGANA